MMPLSNQIELRHLRYFKTVGELLHFRNAADKLCITQPGLSRQIQQLEENMGVPLFIRSKRQVQLTEAGKYLMDEVDFIINHLAQVIETASLINKGEQGEVRIGFVGSAMHSILPDILKNMNTTFPKMHTSLDQLGNKEQLDAIAHDKLDIGFIRSVKIPQAFEKKELIKDNFALVLPKDHSLEAKDFKNISQLKEDNFILFSRDYSDDYYELVMSIFDKYAFSPKVLHRSVHPSTIFKLVENQMGVAIIPSTLKSGFNMQVKFIELIEIPQRTSLTAVWKNDNRNPALKNFLSLL